ncbi:MAG TPA: thiol:disulfide interchange protein DsbA/DsbL [Steroidobacteraceae bacterium]
MRKHLVLWLVLICCASVPAQAQTWIEGRNYFRIVPAQNTHVAPGKIEVTEVFSYACPFCAQFNPYVQALQRALPANAALDFLPASFNPAEDWPMFQRATCTAQILGILDRTHAAMFAAVWTTGELAITDPQTRRLKNPLPTIEDAARFYHRLTGVAEDKFLATAKSFSVDMKMRSDDALVQAYHVDGTPTLIVNGKYRITGVSAGGMPQMIDIARWLVAREAGEAH